MFAFKFCCVSPLVLGSLIAFVTPLYAYQDSAPINQFSSNTSSRRTLSDRQRTLSDTTLSITGNVSTLGSVSQATTRNLPETTRKLSDAESQPAISVSQTGQLGSPQNLSDIPGVQPKFQSVLPATKVTPAETVRFLSDTRRKLSDSQPALASGNREFGVSSRRRILSDTTISSETDSVAVIGTGIPHSQSPVQRMTFQDSRGSFSSSRRGSLANPPQTVQPEFKSLTASQPQTVTSVPDFVDPEAFRVPSQNVQATPQRISSSQIPSPPKFQNASTRINFSSGRMVQDDEVVRMLELGSSETQEADDVTSITPSDDSLEKLKKQNQAQQENRSSESEAAISLPSANVNQPIGYDPLRSAFASHTVGDPYVMSSSLAPSYRPDATSKLKTWRSPNLKHEPLYFEDAALERHGQSLPKMQPVLSAARFYSSVLLLPQKALVTPPKECVYPLGHDRPGECVPRVRETNPRRGGS